LGRYIPTAETRQESGWQRCRGKGWDKSGAGDPPERALYKLCLPPNPPPLDRASGNANPLAQSYPAPIGHADPQGARQDHDCRQVDATVQEANRSWCMALIALRAGEAQAEVIGLTEIGWPATRLAPIPILVQGTFAASTATRSRLDRQIFINPIEECIERRIQKRIVAHCCVSSVLVDEEIIPSLGDREPRSSREETLIPSINLPKNPNISLNKPARAQSMDAFVIPS
jgi:hypothetical protein